jgi:hypothetical protein
LPLGAVVPNGAGCVGLCPAMPVPAETLHRVSTTPEAMLAKTAMLEAPATVALADVNEKSSKATAADTCNA